MSFKKLSYLCIALGFGCAMTIASCGDDEDKGNNKEEQQVKVVKAGDPCTMDDFKEFCNDEGKLVLCEEKEQNSDERVIVLYDCSMMNSGDDKYICATFDEANCYSSCSEDGALKDYCDSEYNEKVGPEYMRFKCEMSKDSHQVWHNIGSERCEGSDVACCAELNGNSEENNLKEGDPCTIDDFKEFCNDEGKLVLCEEKEQNSDERVIVLYDCSEMNGGDDHSGDEKYICATFDEASCYQICSEDEDGTSKEYCDSEEKEYTKLKCEMSKDSHQVWHNIGSDKCEGSDVACCAEL